MLVDVEKAAELSPEDEAIQKELGILREQMDDEEVLVHSRWKNRETLSA